jgi:hypothetical protein
LNVAGAELATEGKSWVIAATIRVMQRSRWKIVEQIAGR